MTTLTLDTEEVNILQTVLKRHNIEFSDPQVVDGGGFDIRIDTHSPQMIAQLCIMVGMEKMGKHLISESKAWSDKIASNNKEVTDNERGFDVSTVNG